MICMYEDYNYHDILKEYGLKKTIFRLLELKL